MKAIVSFQPPVDSQMHKIQASENHIEWSRSDTIRGSSLTVQEITALKVRGTRLFNIKRAERIKSLIEKGLNRVQICQSLRCFGKGYSESAIEKDFAILKAFNPSPIG